MERAVALLTDFGIKDVYVGVIKGVIQRIHPEVQFIDISHAVQPHNVRQAAFALLDTYRYFAEGTVFLVVVDPGVGSTRRPLAVQAGGYTFVAPDNGILSYILAELDGVQFVELTNPDYQLPNVSHTFHGRDIFAPAAAHLALGVPLQNFGPSLENVFMLPTPHLTVARERILGEVMHVDQFGNIVTSIGHIRWVTAEKLTLKPRFGDSREQAVPFFADQVSVILHRQTIKSVLSAYSDTPRGNILALISSNGYLEIAMNQGHAASRLDVHIGDRVEMQIGVLDGAVRN